MSEGEGEDSLRRALVRQGWSLIVAPGGDMYWRRKAPNVAVDALQPNAIRLALAVQDAISMVQK